MRWYVVSFPCFFLSFSLLSSSSSSLPLSLSLRPCSFSPPLIFRSFSLFGQAVASQESRAALPGRGKVSAKNTYQLDIITRTDRKDREGGASRRGGIFLASITTHCPAVPPYR